MNEAQKLLANLFYENSIRDAQQRMYSYRTRPDETEDSLEEAFTEITIESDKKRARLHILMTGDVQQPREIQ